MNYSLLTDNITTLKAASEDSTNREYMTESKLLVVNFDRVKRSYLNDLGYSEETAASVDALAKSRDGNIYMIEFKNGDCKAQARDIRMKIKDSLLIWCDICRKRLDDARKEIVFVLVMNPSNTKLTILDKIAIARSHQAGRKKPFCDVPFCGFDKIEGVFVKNVQVFDAENFSRILLPALINFA